MIRTSFIPPAASLVSQPSSAAASLLQSAAVGNEDQEGTVVGVRYMYVQTPREVHKGESQETSSGAMYASFNTKLHCMDAVALLPPCFCSGPSFLPHGVSDVSNLLNLCDDREELGGKQQR